MTDIKLIHRDKWFIQPFQKDNYLATPYRDKITLIQQFFIPSNLFRTLEIKKCLQINADNPHLDHIYLLNERIYTQQELGLNDKQFSRVTQVEIGHRLTYGDVVKFVNTPLPNSDTPTLSGYIVFSNSDIYLDPDTLRNVYYTSLSKTRSWYALLRTEAYYNALFGPNSYAQDTWIFHTNPFRGNSLDPTPLNYYLGKLGCDNKICHDLSQQQVKIYNEPLLIKTMHLHKSVTRDYDVNDRLEPPYLQVIPNLIVPELPQYQFDTPIDSSSSSIFNQ